MEFLWSIVSNDITCTKSVFEQYIITTDPPDITFFNPCLSSFCLVTNNCEDTLVISETVNVLKSPELSLFS